MNKRLVLIISAVLCIIMVFSGCANTTDANNEDNTQTSVSEEATSQNQTEQEQDDTQGNMDAAGLPIVEDTVTYTIAYRQIPFHTAEFNDMGCMIDLEEATNVHIEWIPILNNMLDEKKNLMFASDDLPDAFWCVLNASDEMKYGSQGLLIPLQDLLAEWAPNFNAVVEQRPQIMSYITTPDLNIYALPKVEEMPFVNLNYETFINKTWLDKLDLPVPETTEEFYNTLVMFRDTDLNENGEHDEIPFTFEDVEGLYPMYGSFGRTDNVNHIVIENGEVVFTADKDEHKEGIKYFHKLYEEGLLDPEGFTQDQKQIMSKGQQDELLLGSFQYYEDMWVVGTQRAKDDYVTLLPLAGPNGDRNWERRYVDIAKSYFAITANAENPEILVRWIDQIYIPENSLEIGYGTYDYGLVKNDEGKWYLPIPEGQSMGEFRHSNCPGWPAPYALLDEYLVENFQQTEQNQRKTDRYELYKPYLLEEIYPDVYFTSDQQEQISILQTDINSYIDKMQAKWILEGGVEEEWASYIEQLNKMGLDDLITIFSDAYESFKNIDINVNKDME